MPRCVGKNLVRGSQVKPDRSKNSARARHGWVAAFAGVLLAMSGVVHAQTTVINRASVAPPTGVISNDTACLAAGGAFDPATRSCTAESAITVTPVGPVVTLVKTGPAAVTAGASFDYTLTVTNAGGTATAATIVVQDQLPAGMVATAVSGATCGTLPSAAGALLTCNVTGPLAAGGGTASFTLTLSLIHI